MTIDLTALVQSMITAGANAVAVVVSTKIVTRVLERRNREGQAKAKKGHTKGTPR